MRKFREKRSNCRSGKSRTVTNNPRTLSGVSPKAVLVFPDIKKAAFIVGAQYGYGALRKGARTVGYYRTGAARVSNGTEPGPKPQESGCRAGLLFLKVEKMEAATEMLIRDRIKELRRVRARDLLANPKNWQNSIGFGQCKTAAHESWLCSLGKEPASHGLSVL